MSCQKKSTYLASQERPNHANLLAGTLHPASPNHSESQSSLPLLPQPKGALLFCSIQNQDTDPKLVTLTIHFNKCSPGS